MRGDTALKGEVTAVLSPCCSTSLLLLVAPRHWGGEDGGEEGGEDGGGVIWEEQREALWLHPLMR